jgi:acyl-CoA thioesterase-2
VVEDGQALVDELVSLLDLESIEKDIFRGRQSEGGNHRGDVFGGLVAAQALMAAGRTVEPDRSPHSLHAYFIRRGDPSVPIVFTVDRIRDGRSFTTRRVVAIQHGQGIFALEASFQLAQPGIDSQTPMPVTAPPESFTEFEATYVDSPQGDFVRRLPFEMRQVPAIDPSAPPGSGYQWLKAKGRLPDDPLVHACALTFATDLVPARAVLDAFASGRTQESFRTASLDHAVWFHRPFRADEWLLVDAESTTASGARGLGTARMYAADGRQIATLAQEMMIRVV